MSNFAESHSLRTFNERYAAKSCKDPETIKKWLNTDAIIDQVYYDLVNGLTRSEVLKKLQDGLYEGQSRPIHYRTASDYVKAAQLRMHYDFEAEMDEIRADLYSKMIAVYNDAMQKNDRYNAIGALNSIMKLTGAEKKAPDTAIQINSDKENVTINFGFNNNEEE